MRILSHYVFRVFSIGAVLMVHSVLADPTTLPLTPKQIAKLQSLVSTDSVPTFQMSTPHEHVVWNQTPIDVTLPIDKERMVNFPDSIAFGYDKNALPDNILRVQNNGGTLYLLAKAEFATQRVQVKLNNSGQIVLLNLSAQKGASDMPLDVVIAQPSTQTLTSMIGNPGTQSTSDASSLPSPLASAFADNAISYITLTRFAVQQLYAPKRLLVQPPTIYRTPMHTQKTVPLLRDGSVLAMPLASWRGGDLTVTAVLLRNQLHQVLTLDPRNLCGDWRTTTFFPQTVLQPAGNRQDSTTVFLVANRSFADALQVCIRGF